MWKSLEEFHNRELYMDAYDHILNCFKKAFINNTGVM